jgi:chitinase
MAGYYGPVPPPVPYNTKPQLGQARRPSQSAVDASLSEHTRKNAVYYPNYRVYRGETPASLNFGCISHVFYAFAHVSPDGGVFVSCPTFLCIFETDPINS